MNTIIIHPFNRVKSTPMHETSAALISPVSKWYIKPAPWWIDDLEEVGLQPIVETDEVVEEEEDVIDEQEEDEEAIDEDEGAETVAFGALVDTDKEFTFEDFQGNVEGEQRGLIETDVFQDVALEDTDLPEVDRDPRDDEIDFLDVMLVNSEGASFDNDDTCEGDDTVTDITFIGEDVTIILEVQTADEYEWDEKAMLNIVVVEVGPENDDDEGAMNGSTTTSALAAARIK